MIGNIHLHAGTGHKTASATTPSPPFSAVKKQSENKKNRCVLCYRCFAV